jgi:serine/threonine protein kinase
VAYMSPEQLKGEDVDHRSDIWALGVVLYEMVTGEMPFRGEYEQAMSYSILNEAPKPVRSLRPDVPVEIERLIDKTLSKNPGERYQNSTELIAILRSFRRRFESSSVDTDGSLTGITSRPNGNSRGRSSWTPVRVRCWVGPRMLSSSPCGDEERRRSDKRGSV